MAKPITLEEFIKYELENIEKFRQWWIIESKKDKNNFPLTMGHGEWDEQLMMFDPEAI